MYSYVWHYQHGSKDRHWAERRRKKTKDDVLQFLSCVYINQEIAKRVARCQTGTAQARLNCLKKNWATVVSDLASSFSQYSTATLGSLYSSAWYPTLRRKICQHWISRTAGIEEEKKPPLFFSLLLLVQVQPLLLFPPPPPPPITVSSYGICAPRQ